jgi:hypothetical protein
MRQRIGVTYLVLIMRRYKKADKKKTLKEIWFATDQMCSKRFLTAMI